MDLISRVPNYGKGTPKTFRAKWHDNSTDLTVPLSVVQSPHRPRQITSVSSFLKSAYQYRATNPLSKADKSSQWGGGGWLLRVTVKVLVILLQMVHLTPVIFKNNFFTVSFFMTNH